MAVALNRSRTFRELIERKPILWAALISTFIISFSVPVSLLVKFSGAFNAGGSTSAAKEPDDLFPKALLINNSEAHAKIPHSEELNPALGKDFLLVAWVKIRKLPEPGDKSLFLSKYDMAGGKPAAGYAIGIANESDVLRPIVFWGSSKHPGRWYNFSEVSIQPKSWIMFAMSLHRNQFLGLHIGLRQDGQRPQLTLAGGYDLGEHLLPDSKSDIIFGAVPGRQFRGSLGPLGVFSGEFSKELKDILKSAVNQPHEFAGELPADNVKIWKVELEKTK